MFGRGRWSKNSVSSQARRPGQEGKRSLQFWQRQVRIRVLQGPWRCRGSAGKRQSLRSLAPTAIGFLGSRF